jgi:hypothetical protein
LICDEAERSGHYGDLSLQDGIEAAPP